MNITNNINDKNLANIIIELHKAFDCLNNAFYDGQLPQVIITIQTKGKRNSFSWFSRGEIWDDGTQQMHEINISAEYTNKDFLDIMTSLHHEMIHLFCTVHQIKDTSRSGTYHNKNFKLVSENHGFYYPDDAFDSKSGWTFSKLTDESKKIIEGFDLDISLFNLKRHNISEENTNSNSKKKKSNIIKWVCPSCGAIVRSSKLNLNIICGDCEQQFKIEVQDN